jgi:hypothetical protein
VAGACECVNKTLVPTIKYFWFRSGLSHPEKFMFLFKVGFVVCRMASSQNSQLKLSKNYQNLGKSS